jgi:flagellar assembly protein FliH
LKKKGRYLLAEREVMTSLSNLIKREDDFRFDIESFEEEDLGDEMDMFDPDAQTGTLVLPLGNHDILSPVSLNHYDPDQRLAKMERDAYERGFDQGQKDGVALGRTKAQETWRQMVTLFESLSSLREKILEEAEEEILKLSMTLARQIVKKEVTADPDTVRRSLHEALTLLKDKSSVRILINPDDMKIIEPYLSELTVQNKLEKFELAEDHFIEPGGCVLETGFGRINAGIENQLLELEKEMENIFRAGGGARDGTQP